MARAKGKTEQSFGYDLSILLPVLFLVGIGITMVYSASSVIALEKYGNGYYYLKKQGIFALSGLMVLVTCSKFPYRLYRSFAYVLLLVAFVLLGAVLFSGFGHSAGGATRWLRFGGLSFQPSEFARIALVIFMAYSLAKKSAQIKDFYIGFVPHVIVLCLFTALIVLQPDFGSVVILATITWIMMFVGGVRLKHLFLPLIPIVPVGIWYMISAEYRVKRLLTFLDPWQNPSGEGYQIVHSLMAFGSGGLWGSGLGQSYQKLFYLPEPHTDFIFSVIGEELGLVGVLVIVGLYALIFTKGFFIATRARDLFGSYLAMGLTVAMGLQVVINMMVTLGLLPTKGLTLPFLSYGGTSLLLNMACIGILMNIGGSRR